MRACEREWRAMCMRLPGGDAERLTNTESDKPTVAWGAGGLPAHCMSLLLDEQVHTAHRSS